MVKDLPSVTLPTGATEVDASYAAQVALHLREDVYFERNGAICPINIIYHHWSRVTNQPENISIHFDWEYHKAMKLDTNRPPLVAFEEGDKLWRAPCSVEKTTYCQNQLRKVYKLPDGSLPYFVTVQEAIEGDLLERGNLFFVHGGVFLSEDMRNFRPRILTIEQQDNAYMLRLYGHRETRKIDYLLGDRLLFVAPISDDAPIAYDAHEVDTW